MGYCTVSVLMILSTLFLQTLSFLALPSHIRTDTLLLSNDFHIVCAGNKTRARTHHQRY
ncbi:hypothetical protein M758_UG128800 [Ceratodon purpureus]|nr:hypothetical protein M758_UG128800 [Ceratodon purpureus]